MFKVKIGKTVYSASGGEILSAVLNRNGENIEHLCGGKGTCGKCKVKVNGKEELSCRYVISSDIEVELYERSEILSETGAKESGKVTENLCFALDIGTTTLALALVSLDEKKAVKVVTASNPQRTYGADIMTRIDYCQKNSVTDLNKVIIAEINKMIAQFGDLEINTMYVSGNATMLHLFFGIDCSSIGVAPYTPVFLESKTEKASSLGISGIENVISLPSVSSFVGADIVAGLNYIDTPEEGKYNLLIDLGTNAEIVLYSASRGLATAAAAGPCFEGANISCGMSATPGAIYAFEIDEDGNATYKTIGNAPAKGLCGTGLIDIIAELVANETIDETGYMDDDEYPLAEGVSLSGGDIRQYQLAKSAVYSAVLTLMKTENVGFDDISAMYISGGFSAKISISNAVKSGLLPAELADKTVALNNSSLLGTIKYACEGGDLSRFTDTIEYVDLSANPYFTDLFVENMMFEPYFS
ncbi:MAG: DUF4445 domain-containing protein [Clostridia bacterium]|nr:DUF4445 domain-containing protein [Clostridia bacterium]